MSYDETNSILYLWCVMALGTFGRADFFEDTKSAAA